MEFLDIVRKRRSVRHYSPNRPPFEELERIVDLARRAPSAGFSQGRDLLVLDDPDAVDRFWTLTHDPGREDRPADEKSPVVILVFSDPQRYLARYSADDKIEFGLDDLDRWPVRFWDVDGVWRRCCFSWLRSTPAWRRGSSALATAKTTCAASYLFPTTA